MKRVLVFVDDNAVAESLDLVEVADRLYGKNTREVWALVPEGGAEDCAGVVNVVVRIDGACATSYDTDGLTGCVAELHREHRFDAILVPSTTMGRMLAPRIAMRLHAGLVAEVTDIQREGDRISLVRPAFSGRMFATVTCKGKGPLMMSVGRKVFTRSQSPAVNTRTVVHTLNVPAPARVRLLCRESCPAAGDIRESAVLVAGGGGVLSFFGRLEELAGCLGGMVAASRRAVDSGIAPRSIQVGQSGKAVAPQLYFAMGISGSIQHVVGIRSAKHIIAVNTDRYAPICSLADIVVEGDASVFIDKLAGRIRRRRPVDAAAEGTTGHYGQKEERI